MNPFATPDRIFVSRGPQDMRAGIQRLAAKVAADFGGDPVDGALYCFVSRDLEKMKMLRFDVNGGCMSYCRLAEGCFKWEHRPDDGKPVRRVERRQLMWLLDGLSIGQDAPAPITAKVILRP